MRRFRRSGRYCEANLTLRLSSLYARGAVLTVSCRCLTATIRFLAPPSIPKSAWRTHDSPKLTPGVQKYVDAACKLLAQRDAALARMKALVRHHRRPRPVHRRGSPGRNQGAVIEPALPLRLPGLRRRRRARGRPGLPHPDLVLHAHRQPDDLLPRVGPGPARGLPDGLRYLLPRHGLGHVGHRRRRRPVPGQAERRPGADEFRLLRPGLRRDVPALLRPQDEGARHRMPLGPASLGHRGLEVQDRRRHALPLHGDALATPSSPSPTSRPWRTWPTSGRSRSSSTRPARRRP